MIRVSDAALKDAFERHRRFLWAVCYRMTGSGADAEDLVQDTFERALRNPPLDTRRELKPWLLRVAMNACKDHLRRRKAQPYAGPWLPGPVETPLEDPYWLGRESPEARYGRLESVSFAFLRAVEALTSSQRAVLLLREVFDLSVQETASVLEMSEANVKTTLHRARAAMAAYDAERCEPTSAQRIRALRALRAFLIHVSTNNVEALRALLAEDAVVLNDGGGEYFAAQKPVRGLRRIVSFHRKVGRINRHATPIGRERLGIRVLNGTYAMVGERVTHHPKLAPRIAGWVELDRSGRIREIVWVVASRKLSALSFDGLPRWPMEHVIAAMLDAARFPGPARWLLPMAKRFGRRIRRSCRPFTRFRAS